MKSYSKSLVTAGIVLIVVAFLFVFPYVGFAVNKQYANVTEGPINMSGLDPQDPLNLFIIAVMFFGGIGLLVKGFIV